jgi:hypothetical protein
MPPIMKGWTLDKHFPVAMAAGLILQTAVIVSWGQQKYDNLDSRVSALEKSDDGQSDYGNRITVLEQKFEFIADAVGDIRNDIKALLLHQQKAETKP